MGLKKTRLTDKVSRVDHERSISISNPFIHIWDSVFLYAIIFFPFKCATRKEEEKNGKYN